MMHDNPTIFPTLPAAFPDADYIERVVGPNRGTAWQTCWEYIVTHKLSDSEGAAFWTGAGLIFEALRRGQLARHDAEAEYLEKMAYFAREEAQP